MSFGKKNIINNISSKAQISKDDSNEFFKSFLNILFEQSKSKQVKISNFGTFLYKKKPQRLERNPKTKKEFIISARLKLFFKSSNKIKNLMN